MPALAMSYDTSGHAFLNAVNAVDTIQVAMPNVTTTSDAEREIVVAAPPANHPPPQGVPNLSFIGATNAIHQNMPVPAPPTPGLPELHARGFKGTLVGRASDQEYKQIANGKVCYNCKATEMPAWRRHGASHALCNGCHCYWKKYAAHRPVQIDAASITPPAVPPPLITPQSDTHESEATLNQAIVDRPLEQAEVTKALKVCYNCGSTNTSRWRRDEEGHDLCSACKRNCERNMISLLLQTDTADTAKRGASMTTTPLATPHIPDTISVQPSREGASDKENIIPSLAERTKLNPRRASKLYAHHSATVPPALEHRKRKQSEPDVQASLQSSDKVNASPHVSIQDSSSQFKKRPTGKANPRSHNQYTPDHLKVKYGGPSLGPWMERRRKSSNLSLVKASDAGDVGPGENVALRTTTTDDYQSTETTSIEKAVETQRVFNCSERVTEQSSKDGLGDADADADGHGISQFVPVTGNKSSKRHFPQERVPERTSKRLRASLDLRATEETEMHPPASQELSATDARLTMEKSQGTRDAGSPLSNSQATVSTNQSTHFQLDAVSCPTTTSPPHVQSDVDQSTSATAAVKSYGQISASTLADIIKYAEPGEHLDWTKVTDPGKRKKIQNKIHTRKYRERRLAAKVTAAHQGTSERTSKATGEITTETENTTEIEITAEGSTPPSSTDPPRRQSTPVGLQTEEHRHLVSAYVRIDTAECLRSPSPMTKPLRPPRSIKGIMTKLNKLVDEKSMTDEAFVDQVKQVLRIRHRGKASTFAAKQAGRILHLLELALPPTEGEALFLSGEEATKQVAPNVFFPGPIFTRDQQALPLHTVDQFLAEYYDDDAQVDIQDPGANVMRGDAHVRRVNMGQVKERFADPTMITDRPWNLLELATHREDGLRPAFLNTEDCCLLSKLKIPDKKDTASRRGYAPGWKEIEKWALVAQGGALTEPHQDSHGYSTFITVNQGIVGFGWLSNPTEVERLAWRKSPFRFAGGRWCYSLLRPGTTVYFPAGTVHFVFRLPAAGHTLAFGGHVLRCSQIVRWVEVLLEEKQASNITNEDMSVSAPAYLERVEKFVMQALKTGGEERWGGKENIEEFLRLKGEFMQAKKGRGTTPPTGVKAAPKKGR